MKPIGWLMPIVTGLALSSVYLLPKPDEMAASAISMELPMQIGQWELHHKPASQLEKQLLADDTEFSKAICLRERYGEFDPSSGARVPDRIDLSVVLSGHDLNNSIHRPERCMPSQGHVIGSNEKRLLEMPDGRLLPVRRLLSTQSIPMDMNKPDEYTSLQCVSYYYFVGNKTITEDHLKRTFVDIKDRLVYGKDQRWAYVSASMWYGNVPWIRKEVTLDEADRKLQRFLVEMAKDQIDWSQLD